jgi:hypothetical protein
MAVAPKRHAGDVATSRHRGWCRVVRVVVATAESPPLNFGNRALNGPHTADKSGQVWVRGWSDGYARTGSRAVYARQPDEAFGFCQIDQGCLSSSMSSPRRKSIARATCAPTMHPFTRLSGRVSALGRWAVRPRLSGCERVEDMKARVRWTPTHRASHSRLISLCAVKRRTRGATPSPPPPPPPFRHRMCCESVCGGHRTTNDRLRSSCEAHGRLPPPLAAGLTRTLTGRCTLRAWGVSTTTTVHLSTSRYALSVPTHPFVGPHRFGTVAGGR